MSRREHRGPSPAADAIIELPGGGIVLIERKYPPIGWAIPGGFIDEGESAENAARREAKEETGLDVTIKARLGVYSDPDRDPRGHTIGIVYIGEAKGELRAGDDAAAARAFDPSGELPEDLAFDHAQIRAEYRSRRALS